MLPHQLELLSPARDADIGIEAVNHGADAVYIGGPSFGARTSADNSVKEIARLAKYAHRFGSRIFVTMNTILRDDELEPARKLAWQLYDAGVDALIIQDMGLLEIDLPPIQLHASTQTDIRTPEKARFLQDAGLSQIVLARELTLQQIAAIRAATDPERCTLEFFVHGALCVAYSGQCFISHAHTGRSANRGDCSQACRLPYEVKDSQGRIVAHEKHVLSMKDNNQSDNLRALIDAGARSFKIEGRYKDMGYVKNITAHYRVLLDEILEDRQASAQPLARASSGSCTLHFQPDPDQNFNREFTDYFVQGRKEDIGAFDTPKNPGRAIGYVTQVGPNFVELETDDPATVIHNGDGLCYLDLQKELTGLQINRAERLPAPQRWRVYPKDAIDTLKDLRKNTVVNRNRDMDWVRSLEKKSAERRIGAWLQLDETPQGLSLTATDEDGHSATATLACTLEPAKDATQAQSKLREALARLGDTIFEPLDVSLNLSQPWFVPASLLNPLRREAIEKLEAARAAAWQRLPRAQPVQPPAPYPEDTLTYLANVFNHKARDFYAKHGVKVIAAAYESQEEPGEVSLMITKHCVRFSLSLCPKQAKGVTGVQGTVRAEPMQLIHGDEKLTLRFDCKPCEMHVVGKMKPAVLKAGQSSPLKFYRTRPMNAVTG
ncbi:MAG: U32 family peptidase [Polaromonas sp.]|uniref:peptidase U32 family protein n=1 Tax=Polaromonas sp. TaxID=1869339 RepID=UPI002715ACD5|nr:U32 family peptidase [Polaromonas sp.]MDO9481354.1 U32 family peptidase [Hydrogenophaga sp.]MDP3799340.1 U32 family peptidase [Polaromonas sp.]